MATMHADVVVIRAVLGIIALGLLVSSLIVLLLLQNIFDDNMFYSWTLQIVTVLGGTVLQIFIAAIVIVFLILVWRHQKLVVPSVDYDDYVLDVVDLECLDNSSKKKDNII